MAGFKPALIALFGGVAVLVGVYAINKLARDDLTSRGHYTCVIKDLVMPAPPGMSRDEFLAEVQYQSRLPATLDRTDPTFLTRLQQAFAAHPWVEHVKAGEPADNPPITVFIRVPALAIGNRVLDRQGVLLPMRTSSTGLPTFRGKVNDVTTPSGQKYPVDSIAAIAQTVGWLKTNAPELIWDAAEITNDGLILIRKDGGKAIWGTSRPPEPSLEQKLAKLKAWTSNAIDLRK